MSLSNVKVGDKLIRKLAGVLEMPVIVASIEDGLIYVGSGDGIISGEKGVGWKFRIDTGGEVDEDLEWDGITNTGSILTTKKWE